MQVNCPECDKSLKAPDTAAGKLVKCPGCKKQFRLPEAEIAEAELEPAVVDDEEPEEEEEEEEESEPVPELPQRPKTRSRLHDRIQGKRGNTGVRTKSGKGKVFKILGIGCLTIILLGIGTGLYVWYKAPQWAAAAAREGFAQIVKDLPADQANGLKKHAERVFTAAENGDISLGDCIKIIIGLAENPVLQIVFVQHIESSTDGKEFLPESPDKFPFFIFHPDLG